MRVDAFDRVRMMSEGNPKWDLSTNDRAALRIVLECAEAGLLLRQVHNEYPDCVLCRGEHKDIDGCGLCEAVEKYDKEVGE